MSKTIPFTVGICAHNEEKNIQKNLQSILSQKLSPEFRLKQIIVVSSGSTDHTNSIVKKIATNHPQIKLIIQKKRSGKASAVNKFLKTSLTKILVLSSADLILDSNCLDQLLQPLKNNQVGLTAPQVVPQNPKNGLINFAVHLEWLLHHRINLQFPERPKVGELVAFKKIFNRIPSSSAVDEASIEPLIHFQGYQIKYCPEAIVYNHGPTTIRDFLRQRRRIYAGHTELRHKYGYSVVTYSNTRIIGVMLANLDWSLSGIFKTLLTIKLEFIARLAGFLDYKFNLRNHQIWKIASSQKATRL